ncbi:classical arabinogalactan protein 5-like isoform X2 [Penaeus chinensis]|uniref:classical arabinogalactan protein 5-like isoform X2 n=1 Tax=Penaeus chinensis TaxID=139456 RepID=UPI001FB74AC9|nr:classical arabinogalactan protein 5-like isoform X2 [Penaeus chinensis]
MYKKVVLVVACVLAVHVSSQPQGTPSPQPEAGMNNPPMEAPTPSEGGVAGTPAPASGYGMTKQREVPQMGPPPMSGTGTPSPHPQPGMMEPLTPSKGTSPQPQPWD